MSLNPLGCSGGQFDADELCAYVTDNRAELGKPPARSQGRGAAGPKGLRGDGRDLGKRATEGKAQQKLVIPNN